MTMYRNRRGPAVSGRVKILLAIAAAMLFAVGLYFGIELGKPTPRPDLSLELRPPSPDPLPEPPPPPAPPAVSPGQGPRIAIIIDDLGRSLEELETLGRLGVPLSYAVLPFETQTAEVVAELHRRGEEVLCHLPMEAKNGADPGPGALRAEMPRAELEAATRRALEAVSGAVGANNHMGSGLTPQVEAMATVLEVVREHGLFFVDSRTSADTQAYAVARRLGMPALERQVFLDNERDPELIRRQFEELVHRAEKGEGGVIAIAHPYPETLEVLAAELPKARARGIEIVRVSELFAP